MSGTAQGTRLRFQMARCLLTAAACVCVSALADAAASSEPRVLARQILAATGVKGGLIVHVGCGDGKLTAALRASESYSVHGLDAAAANIAKARAHIQSLGLYGTVSVEQWDGKRLPYIDNLVNLVICEQAGLVPQDEMMRVLCPDGVAYIRRSQPGAAVPQWTKSVKPRPKETDEWTHYLHDASNNAVSNDTVVGPPRRLQWAGSPRWSRHHDRMASMSALVSAKGRLFYIMDQGSRASILLPSKWALFARDAFNGTILWKRPIAKWYPHMWPFKSGHAQLPRRLVAVGGGVYATLSLDAPLTALDAATGETVRVYKGSKNTEEVIASDGVLFLLVNEAPFKAQEFSPVHRSIGQAKARVAKGWPWDEKPRSVLAVRADTGEILWRKPHPVVPLTLAANGERVLFHNGQKIVCLDRKSGEEMWSSEPITRRSSITTNFGPTLVVYQDVVLFAGGDRAMYGLSAKDGKTLWKGEHRRGGHNSPEDLLVVGGLAWSGSIAGGRDTGIFTGRDPRTGEVKNEFRPDVQTYWFHHRCYRSKATVRYLLPSRTGIEFVDPKTKHWETHHWVRGGCIYGIMPSNGLVYAPPHSCACYIMAKLYGFNALAPASAKAPAVRPAASPRLERGPAYASIGDRKLSIGNSSDWPTYRHDAARSGRTNAAVPANLKPEWQATLGGRLSSVTVADGKLFVASIDTHTVHALDANDGKVLWSYTAGGRVDSPPTIYQGTAIFGCADGYVYCLRAADGALAWRFRAAPAERRLMAFEQLESVWPVHGSVLVQDGVVSCVAGRSLFLDGGMRLVRLDPRTGRPLSETVLGDRDPESGKNLQVKVQGLNMPVALPDILSSDGQSVFMRSQRFDLEGRRLQVVTPADPARQAGEVSHLFSSIGFVDGTWFHRGYWVYGRTTLSGAGGYYRAGHVVPAGRILVFDDANVYGYGRKLQYFRWTTPLEHHLFAISKEPPPASAGRRARRGGGPQISIAKSESLNPANTPLTVEAWVKADRGDGVVLARGGPAHGYALLVKGGKPRFAVRVNQELSSVAAKQNVVGKWTHLAGVLTPDKTLQIYVNGELAGSGKASGFITADPHQAMEIGADESGNVGDYKSPFGFTGAIDEVKVYHRALSAAEVKKHCQAPGKPAADDAALVLYCSFDKGDAKDESGKKNHGTVEDAQPAKGKVGGAMKFAGRRTRRIRSALQYHWTQDLPLHVRAMVLADKTLFIAGPPDRVDEEKAFDGFSDAAVQAKLAEQGAAFRGQKGALLLAVSAADGKKLAELKLDVPPAWDGMVAARGRLYLSTTDGKVLCLDKSD